MALWLILAVAFGPPVWSEEEPQESSEGELGPKVALDKGALVTYDIVEPTANAMNVRQVQFVDTFTARPIDGLRAWRVSFGLAEYRSVPEKIEQRQQTAAPQTQQAEGDTVAAADTPAAPSQAAAPELTGFENVLAFLDEQLAPDSSA